MVGEGEIDLVFVPGWISNLDLYWDDRACARFLSRLASFARLIVFDKRGTGLSDPIGAEASLEIRADDLGCVMDAAGSEQAVICGYSEGAATAVLFAAASPERAPKLILASAAVKPPENATLSAAYTREKVATGWGQGVLHEYFIPNHDHDPRAVASWGRFQRHAATRGTALRYVELMFQIDVTDVLGAITAPTLVLSREHDPILHEDTQRAIADAIPGARIELFPGNDHLPWLGDWEAFCDSIERFATGSVLDRPPDRALATVLFTDIVGSTDRAAELGDRRWREVLSEHDRLSHAEVERQGGRLVKSTGDGALATFDGPARGIRAACTIRDAVAGLGVEVRAGLHTGECELLGDDIGGVAVHIAARVSGEAGASEVLVSRTVKDLIAGSGIELTDRGEHALKGIPDEWRLYAVASV